MITSKVISFVATANPVAAKNFYEQTLGLALKSDDPFALVFETNGVMLRVQKVQDLVPARHTVLGWEVQDIAAEIAGLTKRGVRFERYEGAAPERSRHLDDPFRRPGVMVQGSGWKYAVPDAVRGVKVHGEG
jgi:hypothetical protein